jgi:hypothetical protein
MPVPEWKRLHPTWRFDHVAAGKKAMATSMRLYTKSYPELIGRKGGKVSRGFARDPEFAAAMALKSAEVRRAKREGGHE